MIDRGALIVWNSGLLASRPAEIDQAQQACRDVTAARQLLAEHHTYELAIELQQALRDQKVLVNGLRSQIRVAVDNSDVWHL